MIYVCDAIMGSGKTTAAINYINSHPNYRYIYITPYLNEVQRIKENCAELNFQEPKKRSEYHGSKTLFTAELIKNGANIVTTHQAFRNYDKEMLHNIREFGYKLIIDEALEVTEDLTDVNSVDLDVLVQSGYLCRDVSRGVSIYTKAPEGEYLGKAFTNCFRLLKSREVMSISSEDINKPCIYWIMPKDLILAFDDVYILTYLFEGQPFRYFLDMYNLKYYYLGVKKGAGRDYSFAPYPGSLPGYVKKVRNKIVVAHGSINNIGSDETSLSKTWHLNDHNLNLVKNSLYNYLHNHMKAFPSPAKMWSTYKDFRAALGQKGYKNQFVEFNCRATNDYSNRTVLAYPLNLYMNVGQKMFFEKQGVTLDEEKYALSAMVQWIWRSAIRNGQKIFLYLPSSRMRRILYNWLDLLEESSSKGENEEVRRKINHNAQVAGEFRIDEEYKSDSHIFF